MIGDSLTNRISDLKRLSDERKTSAGELSNRLTTPLPLRSPFGKDGTETAKNNGKTSACKSQTPSKRPIHTPLGSSAGAIVHQERPASRMEINSLEHELDERLRLVLDSHIKQYSDEGLTAGFTFDPQKEQMKMVRDKMLLEFGVDSSSLEKEPWLDNFIKCECIKLLCDDISSRFADMLSVSSVQLGNVLRKLRTTYKQSFEQMHISWKSLQKSNAESLKQLKNSYFQIESLKEEVENKETEVQKKYDLEIQRLNQEFAVERARDQEKLLQTEFKMDQMSDTLKYLNGIFKTMQSDGNTIKSTDLQVQAQRLQRENYELSKQNNTLDVVKAQLAAAERKIKHLEERAISDREEMERLNLQLQRREEVVTQLMEKEALRNAEIEKLQKISRMREDELMAIDMKDPATSVLCIKCKKSLDDLSNIRSAIMGEGNTTGKILKLHCESYRILLPNLKGKQPDRETNWLRSCMRCILLTKMREDVNLQFLKGASTRFPAFVYSWFTRHTWGLSGVQLTKTLALADEDRWGLYYGVKLLSKEDPECLVFWSLLDETYGDDGLQFILHCLSVVLSLGGPGLWKQFGPTMSQGASINTKPEDKNTRGVVWLDVNLAKEAVRIILVRALSSHVIDALDAIDALKMRPTEMELKELEELEKEEEKRSVTTGGGSMETSIPSTAAVAMGEEENESVSIISGLDASQVDDGSLAEKTEAHSLSALNEPPNPKKMKTLPVSEETLNKYNSKAPEPTHINLFMWLRLMLQQMHADQIQRAAAIRLMFETASVGALTPMPHNFDGSVTSIGDRSSTMAGSAYGVSNTHVEYPQFQSICQTLFPPLSVSEIATLYASCHYVGKGRVNAEIFQKQADSKGFFSMTLKLPTLPLLDQYIAATIKYGAVNIRQSQILEANDKSIQDAIAFAQSTQPPLQLTGDGEIQEFGSVVGSEVEGSVLKPNLEDIKEKGIRLKIGYTIKTEMLLRSKLATIVHRKLAAITPTIKNLMLQVPEKWQAKLSEALDGVSNALSDSHAKMKQRFGEQLAGHGTGAPVGPGGRIQSPGVKDESPVVAMEEAKIFVDGIQPYLSYRRLLSLASMIKVLCDNPLLPAELFSARELMNDSIRIDRAVQRAENMLMHMEHSLVTPLLPSQLQEEESEEPVVPQDAVVHQKALQQKQLYDRYQSFEKVRKILIARRIQLVCKRFLQRDVAIPRSVRMYISAGYMSGTTQGDLAGFVTMPEGSTRNLNKVKGIDLLARHLLKNREIYHEPWWGQAQVAEILRFKLNYDLKAISLGVVPISLPQAVVGYYYHFWGSLDLAERSVHDFFVCIRAYRLGVPRLRLFAALLGEGRDLDEMASLMLRTPYALAVYFALLNAIHQELQAVAMKKKQKQQAVSKAGSSELAQLGILDVIGSSGSQPSSPSKPPSRQQRTIPTVNEIEVLFPATENAFLRMDKREVWFVEPTILQNVAQRWADSQACLGDNKGIYTDIPEKMRMNMHGQVEVDDFLWAMMTQWAQIAAWHTRRGAKVAAQVEGTYPEGKLINHSGDKMGQIKKLTRKPVLSHPKSPIRLRNLQGAFFSQAFTNLPGIKRILSPLPMMSLKNIVQSVYRPGDGPKLADSRFFATHYLTRIGIDKQNSLVPMHATSTSPVQKERGTGITRRGGFTNSNDPNATKFSIEMEKLLSECALWDTNRLTNNIKDWPFNDFADSSTAVENGVKVTSNFTTLSTSISGSPAASPKRSRNSPTKSRNDGNRGLSPKKNAGKGNSNLEGDVKEPLAHAPMPVKMAVNVEVSFTIVKRAFLSYQNPLNSFLSRISAHTASTSEDVDVEVPQKLQEVRESMESLSEKIKESETDYISYRLYAYNIGSATNSLKMEDTPLLEDILELQEHHQGYISQCSECWIQLHKLFSAVEELKIMMGEPVFPRDNWQGGLKVPVDRAFVYSVHPKNTLS